VHQDGAESGECSGGGDGNGSGNADILTLDGSPVRPPGHTGGGRFGDGTAHPGSPFDAAEDAHMDESQVR